MILIAGAAIGAAAQVIASGVTSGMNAREAAKARKWSKKMYKQRYQMTMADLKAAGLNPLLVAQSGPGAVPGAASAHLDAPDLAGAMQKGAKASMEKVEKGAIVAGTDKTVADTNNAKIQHEIAGYQRSYEKARAEFFEKHGAAGYAAQAGDKPALLHGLTYGIDTVKDAKTLRTINKVKDSYKNEKSKTKNYLSKDKTDWYPPWKDPSWGRK